MKYYFIHLLQVLTALKVEGEVEDLHILNCTAIFQGGFSSVAFLMVRCLTTPSYLYSCDHLAVLHLLNLPFKIKMIYLIPNQWDIQHGLPFVLSLYFVGLVRISH